MSQVKLNLQPPPNVDFVSGYPGIPPGPDRPQASVKGAIEVRVPQAGVKAKWVRIELRKVETLPGGGPANTFYDFVGPSPVNLWSTSDEYSLLRSQDFPFSIRIPESIPPTIALESRAGIAYELLASVCTKGKKGFLRKAKSVVVSTISPIIIDKHELHSTWPVYCQPERRQLAQDGVNLIVERSNTCYGPGDPITVKATVKSDNLHTVILRGFEFYLKESTVYRAGTHGPGKKSAPQVRQMNIAESKVAVNTTLYGGTSHTSDLSCVISAGHTTTTLNAARHIDVTYTLCIKAVMGTGTHVVMELPVIISNWQRNVSFEAINRIGPVPNLSLTPPTPVSANNASRADPIRPRPADVVADTIDGYGHTRNESSSPFNTIPAGPSSTAQPSTTDGRADDFGSLRPAMSSNTLSSATATTSAQPTTSSTLPGRRPASATASNRLVVKNPLVQEQWPTAEQEKVLYEQARMKASQRNAAAAAQPPANVRTASPPPQPRAGASGLPAGAAPATTPQDPYLPAEQEKRLYKEAQEAVRQKLGGPTVTLTHTKSDSSSKSQFSATKESKPTGAALYAQAISAQNRKAAPPPVQVSTPPSTAKPSVPHYLTADQEKAALRRYEEAKNAVDRTQLTIDDDPPHASSAPVAYEALFPATSRGAPASSSSQPPPPSPPADAPPPFESAAGGSNIMAHLSEKERLRRHHEAQDAAASARQRSLNVAPPPAAYSPPAPSGPLPGQYANALEEKEALRRKFAERDNATRPNPTPQPQQPPPRSNSVTASPPVSPKTASSSSPGRSPTGTGFRPTPVPPSAAGSGSSRILTAVEEKALLRAKYEARDAGNTHNSPPPPAIANGSSRILTAVEEKALLRAKYEARDGGNTHTSPPPPFIANGSSRILTAVEEKALLRAKYEGRDAGNTRKSPPPPAFANGSSSVPNGTTTVMPSTPPPLMPRPPVEYIKETQDEDARLSLLNGQMPVLDAGPPPKVNGSAGVAPLDMKPFTPFRAGFDGPGASMPGPPPLPHQ